MTESYKPYESAPPVIKEMIDLIKEFSLDFDGIIYKKLEGKPTEFISEIHMLTACSCLGNYIYNEAKFSSLSVEHLENKLRFNVNEAIALAKYQLKEEMN